jgi:hypothetical protein
VTECSHHWRTCPVHSVPEPDMPPFRVVLTCIYGGAPLKDGGEWDAATSNEVTSRIVGRWGP